MAVVADLPPMVAVMTDPRPEQGVGDPPLQRATAGGCDADDASRAEEEGRHSAAQAEEEAEAE